MSQPIYVTADIRRIEEAAGSVSPSLMERAGAAAAELAAKLAGDTGKEVLVLAGPGNNGGDAYEVATNLKAKFFRVTVVSPAEPGAMPAGPKGVPLREPTKLTTEVTRATAKKRRASAP